MFIPPLDLLEERSIRTKGIEKGSVLAKILRCLYKGGLSATWPHHPDFLLYKSAFAVSIYAYHDLVERIGFGFGRLDR